MGNEDTHVVHHQYPGAHWTEHPRLTEKHWDAYAEHKATIFRNTHAFEIFGMAVARDYDKLAEKFELIQTRLRACWWGPRKPEGLKLQGKEVGNLMDGKAVDGTYGKLATAHKQVTQTASS